jgi:type II secretory pathway pseudopilin PulG
MRFSHKIKNNSLGDTIIEVIIGIAVLGTVMSVAFVSTSHSLQVGTDAGNRNKALGYAQQQIEFIKYALSKSTISSYTANPGQPFCIDPSSGSIVQIASGGTIRLCTVCTFPNGSVDSYIDPNNGSCPSGDDDIYSVAETFGGPSTNVFTVNADWAASNGSGSAQLVLYYKLPG